MFTYTVKKKHFLTKSFEVSAAFVFSVIMVLGWAVRRLKGSTMVLAAWFVIVRPFPTSVHSSFHAALFGLIRDDTHELRSLICFGLVRFEQLIFAIVQGRQRLCQLIKNIQHCSSNDGVSLKISSTVSFTPNAGIHISSSCCNLIAVICHFCHCVVGFPSAGDCQY